jgi:mono/diheme cytochrome c family protein
MTNRALLLVVGAALVHASAVGVRALTSPAGQPQTATAVAAPAPSLSGERAAVPSTVSFDDRVNPLFAKYCAGCHGGARPKAGLVLKFSGEAEAREKAKSDFDLWTRVHEELSTQNMPPEDAPRRPTDDERALMVAWIESNLLTVNGQPDPGPFMVHRLNNREYANTVRDLLYLPPAYDVTSDFPPDERGDGFDNNAGTLTISPLLVEHYIAAAEKATNDALGLDPKKAQQARDATLATKSRLNEPSNGFREDFADRQAKIRLNLQLLAPRAYRRPVTKGEIDELMKFAALSFAHAGEAFDPATGLAARAAMMSPEFLFRIERDPHPDGTGKVFEITEYQLASRLSYFLWSTMPDEQLFKEAKAGTLRQNIDAEIARMLQDPKAISLTKDFLGQWLEIRGLHETTNADPKLLAAMLGETEHFFDYIVRNNRSIMDFLDADYTFVNESLAKLYGIPGITGDEFQKVQVDTARRGGIFTQASFLTLTSKPLGNSRRTSPVVRGKWILENIFNQTIPPPPPNVPSLNLDTNKELKGTVRQIFEQHRADPTCAGCHARMDPYGFALENYDGYGAWREQDNKVNVDASGQINGKKFTTPVEFRALLSERRDDYRRAVIKKMLSYALGRGMQGFDKPALDAIFTGVKTDGDSFTSVITNVVKSYPFQHARGMKGDTSPVIQADATMFYPVLVPLPPQPTPDPARGRGRGPIPGQQPAGVGGRGQGAGPNGAGGATPGTNPGAAATPDAATAPAGSK